MSGIVLVGDDSNGNASWPDWLYPALAALLFVVLAAVVGDR